MRWPCFLTATGRLLYQQTAAHLRARPGDTITIGRENGTSTKVKVDGIVDLPSIDSLFQNVGAPVGAQPQAPPDNVVLLPQGTFTQLEQGAQVSTQVHAQLDHTLPGSPEVAYQQVSGNARNLETALTGGGLVGDNLGCPTQLPDCQYTVRVSGFGGRAGAPAGKGGTADGVVATVRTASPSPRRQAPTGAWSRLG